MEKKDYVKSMLSNTKSNYIRMIVSAILAFFTSVVFARALGPNLYGDYTYVTWFISILTCILGFGLSGTVTKYLPQYFFFNEKKESKSLMESIRKLEIIVIAIVSVILIVTIPLWSGRLSINYGNINFNLILFLSIIAILPSVLNGIYQSAIQALQRFDVFAKYSMIFQFISLSLNTIVALTMKKIEYMVLVLIICYIAQNFLYYKEIRSILNYKKYKLKTKLIDTKAIIKYSVYMYINVIWQQIVWTRSEYFFLAMYCTPKDIAIYGIAFSLVNMVGMIFTPIMNVVNNYLSEIVAKKDKKMLDFIIFNVTKYFIVIFAIIFIYAIIYGKDAISFVYSNKYNSVTSVFIIVLLGLLINQITGVGGSLPFYFEKQKFIIIAGIISGVINITLDITLIPRYGVIGAALANIGAQIFFSIIQFLFVVKIFKVKFPFKELIICSFLSLVILIIIELLGRNIFIKIFLGVIFALIYVIVLLKTNVINLKELKQITGKVE
jgi:O-antigen/teichoic acid export membrane protein